MINMCRTGKEKILLTILPYWDPMIPPMGITSLKAFLQGYGYNVKTVDLIVKKESLDFYKDYFNTLRKCIPGEKRGNFNNIGHDVLQNHMMGYLYHEDEKELLELVGLLVYKSYYTEVDDCYCRKLNKIVRDFYAMLEDYFPRLLEEEKPDVLGVTAYKCTLPASMFVLQLAKKKYPHIKTLMGGGTFNETHAPDSPNFAALLEVTKDYLDKIIIGQGELLFLKYLQGELPESKRVYTKEDINGQFLDFHQLDLPDFSDLDLVRYPYLANTASASCIYQCTFCVASKVAGKYRTKAPRQTVDEMIRMYKQYGRQLFFMTDSLLNPIVTELAKEFITSGVSIYYDSYFRVDDASADIRETLLWRRGGLYRVRLGTESGSQRILDEMDKRVTVKQIKAAVSALAYAGIKTTTYWVVGYPGETEEDFQQTLDLIEELKDDIFQAECNYFLPHYSQQFKADNWRKHIQLLYPEEMSNMLIFQYYTPVVPPLREETFSRLQRFEAHCKKLGIPNPYSLNEHIDGDKRWKKLHKHAVPPMMDFLKKGKYIDENKNIKLTSSARNTRQEDDGFEF